MANDISFVTHLECSMTSKHYEAGKVHGLSDAGKPLLVRYDLAAIASSFSKEELARREGGFWRYRELLPLQNKNNAIDLGEVVTPLLTATAPPR